MHAGSIPAFTFDCQFLCARLIVLGFVEGETQ